jgi:DNA helicase-2/ATP-dependent DNA helicase PcrA
MPHFNSLEEKGGLEEERRLAYVAMTRARRKLYMTHAGQRRRFGQMEPASPSPFLDHLPKEALITDQPRSPTAHIPGGKTAWGRQGSRSARSQEAEGADEFNQEERYLGEGATVFHPTFGQGLVVRLDGQGREARADVEFRGGDTRRIVARFLTLM